MIIRSLKVLRAEKEEYNIKICSIQKKIQKIEDSDLSLRRFKNDIEKSQYEFCVSNDSKENFLSDFIATEKKCKTAQKYSEGMIKEINKNRKIANKLVYDELLDNIRRQLSEYSNSITTYEEKIAEYNKKIEDIDEEIKKIHILGVNE